MRGAAGAGSRADPARREEVRREERKKKQSSSSSFSDYHKRLHFFKLTLLLRVFSDKTQTTTML